MISEKKDLDEGSSSCSNSVTLLACATETRSKRPTLRMLITERSLPHICQLDGSFAGGVHEPITAYRMELGSCDHLGKLLHVGGLDVHDVEALVLDVQVP